MRREKFMAKVNSEHMGCNAFLCSLFRCLKQFGRQLRDFRFMFTKKKLFKEGWTSSSSDCFKNVASCQKSPIWVSRKFTGFPTPACNSWEYPQGTKPKLPYSRLESDGKQVVIRQNPGTWMVPQIAHSWSIDVFIPLNMLVISNKFIPK